MNKSIISNLPTLKINLTNEYNNNNKNDNFSSVPYIKLENFVSENNMNSSTSSPIVKNCSLNFTDFFKFFNFCK